MALKARDIGNDRGIVFNQEARLTADVPRRRDARGAGSGRAGSSRLEGSLMSASALLLWDRSSSASKFEVVKERKDRFDKMDMPDQRRWPWREGRWSGTFGGIAGRPRELPPSRGNLRR